MFFKWVKNLLHICYPASKDGPQEKPALLIEQCPSPSSWCNRQEFWRTGKSLYCKMNFKLGVYLRLPTIDSVSMHHFHRATLTLNVSIFELLIQHIFPSNKFAFLQQICKNWQQSGCISENNSQGTILSKNHLSLHFSLSALMFPVTEFAFSDISWYFATVMVLSFSNNLQSSQVAKIKETTLQLIY